MVFEKSFAIKPKTKAALFAGIAFTLL